MSAKSRFYDEAGYEDVLAEHLAQLLVKAYQNQENATKNLDGHAHVNAHVRVAREDVTENPYSRHT